MYIYTVCAYIHVQAPLAHFPLALTHALACSLIVSYFPAGTGYVGRVVSGWYPGPIRLGIRPGNSRGKRAERRAEDSTLVTIPLVNFEGNLSKKFSRKPPSPIQLCCDHDFFSFFSLPPFFSSSTFSLFRLSGERIAHRGLIALQRDVP